MGQFFAFWYLQNGCQLSFAFMQSSANLASLMKTSAIRNEENIVKLVSLQFSDWTYILSPKFLENLSPSESNLCLKPILIRSPSLE